MSGACDKIDDDDEIDDDDDNAFFPCHHELTVETPVETSTTSSKLADVNFKNISALELDDMQIAEGRVEGEEEELDDDAFKNVELPLFDDDQL